MIKVKELLFRNHLISLSIDTNKNIGVFSKETSNVKKMLLLLAGINKNNNSITINKKSIYDNKEYFDNRIYLDCRKEFIKNFKAERVLLTLTENFSKVMDKDFFSSILRENNVRAKTNINNNYQYTDTTLAIVNFAFAFSCFSYRILYNPLENLPKDFDYKTIITKEKGNIFGITNVNKYKEGIDEIIWVEENNTVKFKIDQKFIVSSIFLADNWIYANKQYIYLYDKELVSKHNITVSFFELGEYL